MPRQWERREEDAPGYTVEIKRGLWEVVKTFQVPRIPGSLWFVLCLLPAFLLLVLVSIKAALLPVLLWLPGQGAMMWLTVIDPYWFDVCLAQLFRRYKSRYEAG
jgi:type IV secretory pathway TrbD component